MAAILEALLSYTQDNIIEMTRNEVDLRLGVSEEIANLEDKLRSLNDYLADAERRRISGRSQSVQGWVRKFKDVMYDATDILDLCHLKHKAMQVDVGCLDLLVCLRKPLFAHDIGSRIRALNARLDALCRSAAVFNFLKLEGMSARRRRRPRAAGADPVLLQRSAVVGEKIEEETRALVEILTNGKNTSTGPIIMVVAVMGVGGIGKTTLAKKVFDDEAIQEAFDEKIWLSVTQDVNGAELLRAAIMSTGGDARESSMTLLEEALADAIRDKRFFLVLDDVWSNRAWSGLLKAPLSHGAAGSRVLLTTRNKAVAIEMQAMHLFYVNRLCPEEAWSLLKKQVVSSEMEEDEIDGMLIDIGMEIIEKCDGLPLAVKLTGGLLCKRERKPLDWLQLLETYIWSVDELPVELNCAIYLSYLDLHPCLKQCFLHYSLLPKYARFNKGTVISMWISEGFLHGDTTNDLEELGDNCYRQLIDRNLIEPEDVTEYTGEECVSSMHDVVRSLAHYLSREEAVQVHDGEMNAISLFNDHKISWLSLQCNEPFLDWRFSQKHKSLRTLISVGGHFKIHFDDSFFSCSSLRTVHIECSGFDALVGSLCQLKHLRYLHISNTDIHRLPEDIGNMQFLQYISIVGGENLMKLPDSIVKVEKLRCLNLIDTSINAIPRGFCGLTNLRTLSWFLAHMDSGGWCSLQELGKLSNLRTLGLYGLNNVSASSFATEARLGEKVHLTDLVLECRRGLYELEQRRLIKEVLDELAPPPSLEKLVIEEYFGNRMPNWMWAPASWMVLKGLKHMKLYNLSYCTQLPDGLGQLPLLQSLEIISAPAIRRVGPEFQHHGDLQQQVMRSFPRLHDLAFDGMVEWEEWEWEEQMDVQCMPALEELLIESCNLRSLPPGLSFHARALKRLVITDARHLKSLDNFASVVELDICFCPELESISDIPKLQKLTIEICPKLTVLEGIPQLKSLVLEDYKLETLPGYLRFLNPRYLLFKCNLGLLKSISVRDDGPEWHKIRHIRHVKAYAEGGGDQRKWYVLYDEDLNNFNTNISDSSMFEDDDDELVGPDDDTRGSAVDPHEEFIGIDGPCENIIKLLMNDQDMGKQEPEVVSICGIEGLGKTTIANAVYGKIVNEFYCRAFVSVSPDPDKEEVIRSIFHQVRCPYPKESGTQQPIDTLKQFLQDRRYLIVLDDIWDLPVWEAIKPALTPNNKQSGIIATTCKVDVAESIGGVYKLPLLSYEDSKRLFYKGTYFGSEDRCPSEYREVSKRILNKCGQLPLAIITISRLLPNGLAAIEEWKKVCNSIGSGLENGDSMKDMRRRLSRSYHDLPEHLRSCLLYISIFPEDYVIRRDNLIQRWIAEELLLVKPGQSLQELGESYFYELINTGMIQPVELDTTGKALACHVPVMMLDFIVYLLKTNEIATTILSGQQRTDLANQQVERLSLQLSTEFSIARAAKSFRHTSSLSIFCDADLMTLLPRFQKLRVLHLEGCSSLENKHIVKCLRNPQLRYLIIGSGGITEIPPKIGDLRFLQTLDLSATGIRELPSTIVHLRRLRCLLVSARTKVPAGIGSLQDLEELADVDICKSPGILEDICTMPELRVLRINLLSWDESYSELLIEALCKMSTKKLKYLSIVTCCSLDFESGNNNSSNIQPVVKHLEKLEILRSTLYKLPIWIGLLNNLQSLSIEVYLFEDALRILGKLPALLFLSLTTAKVGDKLVVRTEGFGCLKTFLLYNRAMGIKFAQGAMKSLERLELSFQAALTEDFSFGLENLHSLNHVQVEIVCFSATDEMVKGAEDAIRSMIAKSPRQPRHKLDIRRTVEQYMITKDKGKKHVAYEVEETTTRSKEETMYRQMR